MILLERADLLAELHAQWDAACRGRGRLVFVEGEAGIGKTSLIAAFVDEVGMSVRVVQGACDALRVPRPLAPLEDIARRVGGELTVALANGSDRRSAFRAFLDMLAARPTVCVLEDLHWADEATLDLVRFVARRIADTPSMIVASHRSDELVASHPLRGVLGDLATRRALRLSPAPLSREAIGQLAQRLAVTVDVDAVQARTGGNPFFVTEVLSAGPDRVPVTVQDAVLARASRLTLSARAVLDAAAILGPRVEPRLLDALVSAERSSIDEGLATGVLRAEAGHYVFRHELARKAILQAIPPQLSTSLHRMALDALLARQGGPTPLSDGAHVEGLGYAADLARHAEGAGDRAQIARWAPVAARAAARRGANREAARHWRTAVEHAAGDATRAELLDSEGEALRATGSVAAAVAARLEALTLWRRLACADAAAKTLLELSTLHLLSSRQSDAAAAVQEAVSLLAAVGHPPTGSLRLAIAQVRLHTGDAEGAVNVAESVLAEAGADAAMAVAALNTLGAARMACEQTDLAIADLTRGLALAEGAGSPLQIAMLLANLGGGCAASFRLEVAEQALGRGIVLCQDSDLDAPRLHQTASLAMVRTLQGRWDEGARLAADVIDSPVSTAIARVKAHAVLGRIHSRRGVEDPWISFEAAKRLAGGAGMSASALAALRAEAAWLEGRLDIVALEAAAIDPCRPSMAAERALWQRLGGVDVEVDDRIVAEHPAALEAKGDWEQAAARWQALGCPYETMRALLQGDEAAQKKALTVCDRLGARPLAERIRQSLRAAGARDVPRGPRASTTSHPAGLTPAEATVLSLLAEGLRTKEIARRMARSPRTVDHHLERVYAKLGVETRSEAVSVALRGGVLPAPPM